MKSIAKEKDDESLIFHVMVVTIQIMLDIAKFVVACMVIFISFALLLSYFDTSEIALPSAKEFKNPFSNFDGPEFYPENGSLEPETE